MIVPQGIEIGKPEEIPEIEIRPVEDPMRKDTPAPATPVETPELIPA